jgi:phage-related protein
MDAKSLGINNQSTDKLYDFERQLTLAGQHLETDLGNRLAQLGPSLGTFITNLEGDAEKLINGVLTPENLDKVEKGLESIAAYLGSDDFKKTLKEVGDDIRTLGATTMEVAKFIADLLPDKYKLPEE